MMLNQIRDIRANLERRKGQKDHIESSLASLRLRKRKMQAEIIISDRAQFVIHEVAKITTEELKYQISEIVSFALSSVFDVPYGFVVDFVTRRNKIEADMYFSKGDELLDPLSAAGGGVADITSMALRLSMWSLARPGYRPILFLDEPMKWLKGRRYPVLGAAMVSEFSKQLGVQIIMNSHDPELVDCADRVIEVSHDGKQSKIIQPTKEMDDNAWSE
jgi:DNA repair exonuclease SbcCD ATPase subunit